MCIVRFVPSVSQLCVQPMLLNQPRLLGSVLDGSMWICVSLSEEVLMQGRCDITYLDYPC